MNFNVVKIEAQNIGGNAFPTYFVELLNVAAKTTVVAHLLKTEDKAEARAFARAYADEHVLRVEDETLVQEMIAAYKARAYVSEAKYKAASDAALAAAILRSA